MREAFKCCDCAECQQAGVTHLEQRRDPKTGLLLHGYPLKRAWEAAERFRAEMQAKIAELAAQKGMR